MKKIHHIGIVSENLDSALNMLNIEKSKIKEVVDDNIQHNLLHLIRLENNDPWIEIIVPKNNNSTVHNFAKKYKMGLHHIGILCNNIQELEYKFDKSVEAVKLGKYELTVASFGGKISTLFIATHNVIIEYVEVKNE